MANTKISELTALTSEAGGNPPVADDVIPIVDNTLNPSLIETKKVTVDNLILSSTQTLTRKTLTDCDASTQSAGNNTTKIATTAFVTTAVEGEDTLAELNDVTISGLADANLLIYDNGDGDSKWENKALSGDGTISAAGAITLAATNTNLTTLANVTTVGTIGAGTWEGDTVAVGSGGTGLASFTSGDILYASGSTTLAKLAKGDDGDTLTLDSGLPAWSATTGDITAVVAGTNLNGGGTSGSVTLNVDNPVIADVTGDLTGNADTVTTNANLTGDVTSVGNATTLGTVAVAKGGTNLTSYATGDVLYATGSTTLAKLAKPGTPAGEVLTFATSASAPSWVAPTTGDITGVTAGTNLNGGGASGDVTLNLDNPVVANLTGNASGSSGSCTGNSATATLASTVTVTDSTADTAFPVVLHDESNALLDDTGAFTYNPNSSTVTATTFVGALTGNASGSSGSCTGNAATVTTNANLTGDVTSSGSNATTIAAGAVDIAMLSATGTASSSTFLRGDNAWTAISGGGDVTKVGTPADSQVGVWTGDGTIEGTSSLVFDSTGLGIGEDTPLAVLHVQGSSTGAVQQFIHNIDGTTDSTADLVFGTYSGAIPTGTGNPGPSAKISAINTASGSASTDLVFSTYGSSGSSAEAMRITSDGDCQWRDTSAAVKMTWDASASSLGIGMTSPGTILGLQGTGDLLTVNSTSSYTGILFSESGVNRFSLRSNDGSGGLSFYDSYGAGAERMRIDSGGSVGIGVVPETDWDSGHTALQVGLTGVLVSGTSATGWTQLMKNARYTGGDTYKYITTDEATRYAQKNDGTHAFDVAVSGTADADITWVEALSIANDGDVKIVASLGIGRVPASTYQLDVQAASGSGNIRVIGASASDASVLLNETGTGNVAKLQWDASESYLNIQTLENNSDILLTPHGTGKIGIGVTDPLALIDARVATPPTAFGSPDLMLGALCDAVGDYSTVGFGWRNADSNRSPAEIGYVCTDSSAGSLGDLIFGTRSVTTSTTAPTERMRIDSGGQVSQPVETTTAASSTSVSYTVDFSKSNLQRWVLDASNEDLTLNTPTNMAAGCTVKLYIDFGATPMITSLTLPSWISMGSDISAPSGTAIIISLTSWGTAVGDVTAEALEEF